MASPLKAFTLKTFLIAGAACMATLLPLEAVVARPASVEITAFGEFGPAPGDTVAAPNTAKGSVTRVVTNKLLRRGDCIVAQLGTRMGILIRHKQPGAGYLPVDIEIRHPPITNPNGRTLTSESWSMQLSDQPLYTGWYFGEAYELVPGRYTIAVLSQGQVVAKKDFTVVLMGTGCVGNP
jgi:hypothetical protein